MKRTISLTAISLFAMGSVLIGSFHVLRAANQQITSARAGGASGLQKQITSAMLTGSQTYCSLSDGGTGGNIQFKLPLYYAIGGIQYYVAAADDFWDLTVVGTDLEASEYLNVGLAVNAAGAASIVYDLDLIAATSGAAALPAIPSDVAVVGSIVVEGAYDWDGGSALPGTYTHGLSEDEVDLRQ